MDISNKLLPIQLKSENGENSLDKRPSIASMHFLHTHGMGFKINKPLVLILLCFYHNNEYTSNLYTIVCSCIIAAANGTNMTVFKSSTGVNETHSLQAAGDFLTLSTREGEVMHIVTTGPVIVTQYSQSGNTRMLMGLSSPLVTHIFTLENPNSHPLSLVANLLS